MFLFFLEKRVVFGWLTADVDRAVVVHACNLRDTQGVAREQSIFAPKRSVAPSQKVST
jgi:hypothetical protein